MREIAQLQFEVAKLRAEQDRTLEAFELQTANVGSLIEIVAELKRAVEGLGGTRHVDE